MAKDTRPKADRRGFLKNAAAAAAAVGTATATGCVTRGVLAAGTEKNRADQHREGNPHPTVPGHVPPGTMKSVAALQGYSRKLSVAPGERIEFMMSTPADRYEARFVRLLRKPPVPFTSGQAQPIIKQGKPGDLLQYYQPFRASLHGCGWQPSFEFPIRPDLPSSMYAMWCRDSLGSEFYVTFIVRPGANSKNKILLLANTNTWNAYNEWGGWSRYTYVSGPPPSESTNPADPFTLSFQRPNPNAAPFWPSMTNTWGDCTTGCVAFSGVTGWTDFNLRHTTGGELWVLNWLEDSGYAVDVCTDYDFHCGKPILDVDRYNVLIITTHPEYWSEPMRANLKSFLDLGDNHSLFYLAGNGIFEKVSYDPGGDLMQVTGDTNATVSGQTQAGGYRNNLFHDTYEVLCVSYAGGLNPSSGFIVTNVGASHPFLCGVKPIVCKPGAIIGTLGLNGSANGWEVDRRGDGMPGIILAEGAPVAGQSTAGQQGHMTYMKLKSDSNFVFSAGSLTFGGSLVVDRNLQMIVKNALTAAGVTP